MNRQPYEKPPRWWGPKLSPRWIRFWRPFRIREQRRKQRLMEVETHGLEHVREARADGCGILITPNHASHADCFSLYGASDALGIPLYVIVAWQVFQRGSRLRARALQQHGCFSIDREGTDLTALRQARDILMRGPYPLVIFPEGEVYHVNDRVMPFREGPAGIALMAAKKSTRPIVCVPSAIKYRYLQDPTPELLDLTTRLERAVLWRPRPDLDLRQRIYHLAEGLLALKEIEFMGKTGYGSLPERIGDLIEFVLGRIEARHGANPSGATVPERVKLIRRRAIEQLEALPHDAPDRVLLEEDLEDAFLVVQALSYPGDYVAQNPNIERIAETLDKFEEDVLGLRTATVRGERKVTVTFGAPIHIETGKTTASELTRLLELRVQELLEHATD